MKGKTLKITKSKEICKKRGQLQKKEDTKLLSKSKNREKRVPTENTVSQNKEELIRCIQ